MGKQSATTATCVRQGAVDRGAEGGAQIDGDVADLRAPGGGLGHQPVGDGCCVAALDLLEQTASTDGVDEADVPGVCDKLPLVGVRVVFPHGLALLASGAPTLQIHHRR